MEINHVIHELIYLEAPDTESNDPEIMNKTMSAKTNAKKKKNVKEIFRKYDADGSYSIDRLVPQHFIYTVN